MSTHVGEHEAALEQLARARRLSPLDPEIFLEETGMTSAYLFLGRYPEALASATRVLARQPNSGSTIRQSIVANALAGNIDEARRVMTRMRSIYPALRLSNLRDLLPFRRTQDYERYVEGLRLAGLPE